MIADLWHRLRALLGRDRWQRELDDEMRFHLEQDIAARVRGGADPTTARREALVALGGIEQTKEATRDASGVRPLDDLSADIRFALRALRRNPGFTLTTIVVLALAIGASAAIFGVVRTVLFAELPYPHADRLVRIFHTNSTTNYWQLSNVDFLALRDQQRSFAAFGGMRFGTVALAGAGEPQAVLGARVSAGFFETFGVAPVAGRAITPRDETVGAPRVAVVTHRFAEQQLGGAAAALSRTITLDGITHTVVGVLPPGRLDFAGVPAVAWTALQIETPTRRGPFGLRAFGRLRDGVTLADAAADVAGISERIFPLWEAGFKDKTARYTPMPLRETIVGRARGQLRLFGGAVLLVLLVAIANVATLMLVRAAAREHELSVRAALGASRLRLARLVVTESMILSGLAAVAGVACAALGLRLVSVIAPALPRAREVSFDAEVVVIALALGLVSGLLVSASPVLAVLRGTYAAARGDARRTGGGPRGNRARGVLVGVEFALAVPLLITAALLGNSFLRLQQVDLGYDTQFTFAVPLTPPAQRYDTQPAINAFYERALQRALTVQGVVAVGVATAAPPDNQGSANNFNLVAHPVPPGGAEPVSPWDGVTNGYFDALRIPLLEGRLFTLADSANAPPVMIVSRAWAQHYFPVEPVLGQLVIGGGCYECPRTTIVGVVGDVKYQGVGGGGDGVYVPLVQANARSASLFVRTVAPPEPFIRPMLDALRGLEPELPLAGVTLDAQVRRALRDPGRWTAVLTAFAASALVLAALGIFGLMSYVVRRQQREIGVRMALGATPADVTRMIVVRGMRYVAAGTAIGLALAMVQGRWITGLLFGVSPRDPVTIVVVSVVLLGCALFACLVPGLRASRIRPIEAIAQE